MANISNAEYLRGYCQFTLGFLMTKSLVRCVWDEPQNFKNIFVFLFMKKCLSYHFIVQKTAFAFFIKLFIKFARKGLLKNFIVWKKNSYFALFMQFFQSIFPLYKIV